MLWFLCLFFLIGGPIFQVMAAGQEKMWRLDPAGPSTVEITGYDEEFQQRNAEQLRWVNLIFLGTLLLTGLLVFKRRAASVYFSQKEMIQLKEQRQSLLKALARLDDQYAHGEIPEASYRAERQRQKQQLVEITQLCNSPLSTSSS